VIKLYIYPTALQHSQDKVDFYRDTTPLSEDGLKRHFIIVPPEEADFFYMGQISCGTYKNFSPADFKYLPGKENKHIIELEGDWTNDRAPQWLLNCICTGNAARTYYDSYAFCVRPCLSKLLVHLAKNKVDYKIDYPDNVSFGFRGQGDPYGTRIQIANIIKKHNMQNEIYFNPGWFAQIDLRQNNDIVQAFASVMKNNILALCPRGSGEDTIRFYEACFFGRVPVIIGSPLIMKEDIYNNSFYYRIEPNLPEAEIAQRLIDIYNTPKEELIKKAKLAKQYFTDVVVEYFNDPTKYFIDFLHHKKLIG
jgi:hypothetical protein